MDATQQNRIRMKWMMPKCSTMFAWASNLLYLLILYTIATTEMQTILQVAVLGCTLLGAIFLRLCAIHDTLRGG